MKLKFGIPGKYPPSKCPDCKAKLKDPVYENLRSIRFTLEALWHIRCECGVILVWSFPGSWIRRHLFPLWDVKGKRVEVT